MIDPHIVALARAQADHFAVWQLAAAEWTPDQIRHRTAGLARVHDGVIRLGYAAPTREQRRWAATLTTPDSILSHASLGAHAGFRPARNTFEVVSRPGRRGRQRIGGLLVYWSTRMDEEDIVRDAGPPRMTVERTLLDLAPALRDHELRKCFREALRLELTTAADVVVAADRHRGRRGRLRVVALADRYVRLPIDRCRSDAEARALELSDAAGRPIPLVNVRVAGEEADQYYPELGRILEIDGPQFHRLKDEDARKTAIWRAAGLQVDRIPSGVVFDHPERYLALAPPASRQPVRRPRADRPGL
jgi:hypothetical protein